MSRDGYMTIILGIFVKRADRKFFTNPVRCPDPWNRHMQTGRDDAGHAIAGPGPRRALG